ncbi:uncharacterized protein LOC111264122 isoform X1 [Varroa jacobsoni]|uniref:Uncharacterized protein n=1 Tax=Varroa destructor TaxID=109461 RepID=A0A7M7IY08_VARDE|nr:uncharacterized protein LOC111243039 [Varroa destructor]XP_022695467.1 uncharacterized protein LOC111264122 isoform X1 [Varroa jacobsoni]
MNQQIATRWKLKLLVTTATYVSLLASLPVPSSAYRPGNETGLARRRFALDIPSRKNEYNFQGEIRGSLFFDIDFMEREITKINLRAFPWGDVDYEGREIIDMWSSNETHLAEEAITKRNAGPALPNLPIRDDQDKINIRIQLAPSFYGEEERDLLLFIDNQLHWRETLPRKFDFDKVVLSEAVARDATPSQVKITATSNKYTHPKEAIRPHPLAFGPPLSKFQRRDAIWGMTPLQVPPGDRYQLQIKGEIAVITLPSPIEVEATLLTNYSSFRLLFDEPYLAKIQLVVANGTLAGLGLLHRQSLGSQELLVSVDEKSLPSPVTDRSFQMTLQRDLDKVAAFVDINGVRLEGAMQVQNSLSILPAHLFTIVIGKPEEHWLRVTEISEKYV